MVGSFDARLEGKAPSGKTIYCDARVYVSSSIKGFFLSKDTLVALSILNNNFPTVGYNNSTTDYNFSTIAINSFANMPLSYVRTLNLG